MNHWQRSLGLIMLLAATLLVATLLAVALPTRGAEAPVQGRVVLDNDRVSVRALTLQVGQSTGSYAHPLPELWVFVQGGVLKSEAAGRRVLWRDGRVQWVAASSVVDPGFTNVGMTPLEIRVIALKPVQPGSPTTREYGYLSYPNIPLEDLLENDRVIVQRFVMVPGQWEGVHGHHPNTLYVYIKGGRYTSVTTNPPTREEGDTPDGYVGWMPAIDIAAGHQSGNVGTTPSDVVWIALKP